MGPTSSTPASLLSVLFWPRKHAPYVMADKHNYADRFPFLRSRIISVDRSMAKEGSKSFKVALEIFQDGGNILCFPEAGRTSKGDAFLTSKAGKLLRIPFKEGFARLVTSVPDSIILPIWCEYVGPKLIITIGKPLSFSIDTPQKEIVERTQFALLELADLAA